DVTGTVESIPLITSSILSKKFAEGAEALVLDVKCGVGAFMKTIAEARGLAQSLVATAKSLDRPLHASITRMDQPLGFMVGNFLEVEESCLLLGAEFPNAEAPDERSHDLIELTEGLCAHMLTVSGKIAKHDEAVAEARRVRTDGSALEIFLRNVELQGGKVDKLLADLGKRRATVVGAVLAEQSGYVSAVDAYKVGTSAVALGAGRRKMADSVSPNVGIELQCKIGDTVIAGDMLARVYGRSDEAVSAAAQTLKNAYIVSEEECDPPSGVFLEEFSTDP
ncbi:MAG: thymidine phosphorylase, partial [Spirochaeta sp.]|nr:thymidine phosphorylase [Spirochaeta sp.]